MARYRWNNPYEWLMEKAVEWDKSERLFQEFGVLAAKLDGDTLQDLYQSDMSTDGYFRDLDKQVPVIFILDEHNEATGTVLFFCKPTCRNLYYTTTTDIDLEVTPHTEGFSRLPNDETVCECCGGEL